MTLRKYCPIYIYTREKKSKKTGLIILNYFYKTKSNIFSIPDEETPMRHDSYMGNIVHNVGIRVQ